MSRFLLFEDDDDQDIESQTLVCICCLKSNVPFINILTCSHADFLNSIETPEIKPLNQVICYQCHNMLKKIKLFKLQVEESFQLLAAQEHNFETSHKDLYDLKQTRVTIDIDIPHIQSKENVQQTSKTQQNVDKNTIFNTRRQNQNFQQIYENQFVIGTVDRQSEKSNSSNSMNVENKNKNIEEALRIINSNKNNDCINVLATSMQSFATNHLSTLTSVLFSNINTNSQSYDEIQTVPVSNNSEISSTNTNVSNNTELSIRNTDFSNNSETSSRNTDISNNTIIKIEIPDNIDDIDVCENTVILNYTNENNVLSDNIEISNDAEISIDAEVSHDTENSNDTIIKSECNFDVDDIEMSNVDGENSNNTNKNNTCIDESQMLINNTSFSNDTIKNVSADVSDDTVKLNDAENRLGEKIQSPSTNDSNKDGIEEPGIKTGEANETEDGPTLDSDIKSVTITKDELMLERSKLAKHKEYKRSKYRCETCLVGFHYKLNLEDHVKRKHTALNEKMGNAKKQNRRKPGARKYATYPAELLEKAVDLVRNNVLSSYEAEKKFSIPRRTIINKSKNIHNKSFGRLSVMSNEEECQIAEVMIVSAESGSPLILSDLRNVIFNQLKKSGKGYIFKGNLPSEKWARAFLKRNNFSLTTKKYIKSNLETTIVGDENEYYKNLENLLKDVPATNILNFAETHLSDDLLKKQYAFKRATKYPEKIISRQKSAVSVVFSASADGIFLPPYIVYKSNDLWEGWCENGPKNSRYTYNKEGWFDILCFDDWFKTVVIPWAKTREGLKIIIGDELTSHLSVETVQICRKENIRFRFFRTNGIHLIQPLDLAFFWPMKRCWREIVICYKKVLSNESKIDNCYFPRLLKELMAKIDMTNETNICKGFEISGIYPFNPSRISVKIPTT